MLRLRSASLGDANTCEHIKKRKYREHHRDRTKIEGKEHEDLKGERRKSKQKERGRS